MYRKKITSLITAVATLGAMSGLAYVFSPQAAHASVAADFDIATHAAPEATFYQNNTNQLIMGVILPAPNTDTSLAGTAPAAGSTVTGTNPWSGATIAVMFNDGGTAGTWEAASDVIVTDDDLDDVYTAAADTQVDCDGSASTGAGTCSPPAAGTALVATESADNLCTDSLTSPTIVFIDAETLDCTTDASPAETNLLGTAAASTAYTAVAGNWAFRDGEVSANSAYNDGEDLYIEDTAGELTYSAAADTTLAGTAPAAGTALTGTNPWSGAAVPVRFFDGGTANVWESGSDVIITDDDASGYYRGDELSSLTVSNAGSAVDADIAAIKVWEDGASAGFDGDETEVGSDTASPYWGQSISTASASAYTSTSNNERIFITIDIASSPTHGSTVQGQLGVNSVVLVSTNDGPTDSALTNANTQTIRVSTSSSSSPPDTTPPSNPSITINDGAETTASAEVTLSLQVTDGSWVEVSEDASLSDAPQVKYTGNNSTPMTMSFTLSAGEGEKTVYARFMDAAGNFSEVVSDTIVFGSIEVDVSMFSDGDLVQGSGQEDVWIVKRVGDKKFKRLILNPDIFNSYAHLSWGMIEGATQEQLDAFTTAEFIREAGGTKVYRVSSASGADTGTKQWLNMTPEMFASCGYDWDAVYTVNAAEIADAFYPPGAEITSCSS